MQPVNLTRVSRAATLALVVAGFAAPAAAAQSADHESQVAAAVGTGHHAGQDLRMPDTIDAANGPSSKPQPATAAQDFRMPDTRDLALGRGTSTAPDVLVVSAAGPVPESGVNWTGVGIGAAGAIGLVLISLGGAVLVARRRRGLSTAH
jgi:hypothetical protein